MNNIHSGNAALENIISDFNFSSGEFERRISNVRVKMVDTGVDVLLIDCVEHMAYLFGYVPPASIYQVILLPIDAPPLAVIRRLDAPTFAEQSWVDDYITFGDSDDPLRLISQACQDQGWGKAKVGVEFDSHFLPVKRFRALEQALPDVDFVDFSSIIWELRLIKSEEELYCLRRASNIADRAMKVAIDVAAAGVPERECAAMLYAEALRAGADNGRCALIASGKRSDSLHGRLGDHTLEDGDILHVESIPLFNGYGARLMRSSVIGKPDKELQESAAKIIEFQDRQFEAMHPGIAACEVDRILRDAVLGNNLRQEYGNFTGYTLGYIGLPKTSDFTRAFLPDSQWHLQAGMVFHMYTYAKGLAFSDTIHVSDSGPVRLTVTPRTLFER